MESTPTKALPRIQPRQRFTKHLKHSRKVSLKMDSTPKRSYLNSKVLPANGTNPQKRIQAVHVLKILFNVPCCFRRGRPLPDITLLVSVGTPPNRAPPFLREAAMGAFGWPKRTQRKPTILEPTAFEPETNFLFLPGCGAHVGPASARFRLRGRAAVPGGPGVIRHGPGTGTRLPGIPRLGERVPSGSRAASDPPGAGFRFPMDAKNENIKTWFQFGFPLWTQNMMSPEKTRGLLFLFFSVGTIIWGGFEGERVGSCEFWGLFCIRGSPL